MGQQIAPQAYEGTPEEVGAQLFADAMGPTVQDAIANGATDKQAVRMFAGMLAALTGMVSGTYGADAALELLRGTADRLEEFSKAGGMVQ